VLGQFGLRQLAGGDGDGHKPSAERRDTVNAGGER
jgi:hypothetical protein